MSGRLPPPPPVPTEAREVCLTTPPPRYYDLAGDLKALELVYGCCERCGARPDETCDALCGDEDAFEMF